jgi:hypothetical protein
LTFLFCFLTIVIQLYDNMKLKQSKPRLVKLPNSIDLTLFLIKEELKSRKLFHALHEVGLDDCYFQPHLDILILQSVGMDDETDETFNIYHDIIRKRSMKIEADQNSIMKQALKVYMELMAEKKKLYGKSK